MSRRLIAIVIMIAIGVFVGACVELDKNRTAEEKGIRETDYLNTLAGVYTADLTTPTPDTGELLLTLYRDGTCLFAEKYFDRDRMAIMTGRWDHSSSDGELKLHLKSRQGARRVLRLEVKDPYLKYIGEDYGAPDLVFVRH